MEEKRTNFNNTTFERQSLLPLGEESEINPRFGDARSPGTAVDISDLNVEKKQ